jgi:hypothetical protein
MIYALAALLVALPFLTSGPWRRRIGIGLFVYLITFGIFLLSLPPLDPWGLLFILIVGLLLSVPADLGDLIRTAVQSQGQAKIHPKQIRWRIPAAKVALALGLFLIAVISSAEPFRAGAYAHLGNIQTVDANRPEIDLNQIVLVPESVARSRAAQSIGQVGSQCTLGKIFLSRSANGLIWAGALEPTSFFKRDAACGYVTLSATDPSSPATFHALRLAATPDGWFGRLLDRVARPIAPGEILEEASFELDDSGHPYWAISLGQRGVGVFAQGVTIDQVLLINAETGAATRYALDTIPAWVDQVIPAEIAAQRVQDWGRLSNGWWNTVTSQTGIRQLTDAQSGADQLHLVSDEQGKLQWFSGVTSPSLTDASLIGYVMMDARANAGRFVPLAGLGTGDAAREAAKAAFKAEGFTPGYPLLYRLFGEETWIVPMLSLGADGVTNTFTGVVLTNGQATASGRGKSLQEAVNAYRTALTRQPGADVAGGAQLETVKAKVERIGSFMQEGQTTFVLQLVGESRLLLAPAGISNQLAVTAPGDEVEVTFVDSGKADPILRSFKRAQ